MLRMMLAVSLFVASVGLGGCQYRPAKEIDADAQSGMKKGPGVFTGRSGEWTIYKQQ